MIRSLLIGNNRVVVCSVRYGGGTPSRALVKATPGFSDQRRLEWLAARKACSRAVRELTGTQEGLVFEDGACYALGERLCYYSITHSANTAYAAAAFVRVGIDHEPFRSFSGALSRRAFSSSDYVARSSLSTASQDKQNTALWTMKEAATKAVCKGLKIPFSSITWERDANLVCVMNVAGADTRCVVSTMLTRKSSLSVALQNPLE